MDRMIYLSMSGAKATLQRQDVLAHNLANVSTTGFRAELQAFRAVPVEGGGASTRVYTLESTPGYDATPGPIAATGRNLDVALKGNAWLAVQGLDGTEAYTRGGSLEVAADGTLTTRNGLTVLGDGGPVQVPANSEVAIGGDGTISARVGNAKPSAIGRLKLVTPRGATDSRRRRPVSSRQRRPVGRRDRAPAGRRVGRLERQLGRNDGGHDLRCPPVRIPDEIDANGQR